MALSRRTVNNPALCPQGTHYPCLPGCWLNKHPCKENPGQRLPLFPRHAETQDIYSAGKLSPSNNSNILFHIILGWCVLGKGSLHTCRSLKRSCSCMYFLVANLLHQLPLEHNSSSTVTFSVLPRAGSLATGKELEWGNSTYIHEIIYKEKTKQNTFRSRRWELWQRVAVVDRGKDIEVDGLREERWQRGEWACQDKTEGRDVS